MSDRSQERDGPGEEPQLETMDRSHRRGLARFFGTLLAAMLTAVLVVALAGVGTAASQGSKKSAKASALASAKKGKKRFACRRPAINRIQSRKRKRIRRRDCRDKRIGKPQNPRRQRYDGKRIPLKGLGRCDFTDPSVCLQPFPNDYFTVSDISTATDRRVNFNAASMPANKNGQRIDRTDYNRADGFSPGQLIVTKVPGLDTPAALNRTNPVNLTNLAAFSQAGQPIVVIDTVTRQRHPIWVEIDSRPNNASVVNLMIHGTRNFVEGRRYIVAMRNLRRANGRLIRPTRNFRLYRDRLLTGKKPIEKRRKHIEQLFRELRKAGIKRGNLYNAWDFTVASENGIAGRVLAMRDDAFGELGDNNLADGAYQGVPPDHSVLNVEDFLPCTEGNPAECEPGEHEHILRRIDGTIDVPCYLNTNGCPPGSQFAFSSPNAKLPTFNNSFRVDVPFRCIIPHSVDGGGSVDPARTSLAGHGLLGNAESFVNFTGPLADENNIVTCGVNWAGFSSDDLEAGIFPALNNLSNFPKIGDHVQQGFINFLYLGRLLAHPDGFADDADFQVDAGGGPEPAILSDALHYFGVSHGGIMGGSLTALAPDHTRAVLNVPAMNHSTLLLRSIHWDNYGFIFNNSYTDERTRPLILSMIQMLWDRAENNGYAQHMTTDPLPETPQHQVLMQVAYGDHQVTNYAAEVMARTVGARVLTPALDPGRHWDVSPFFGIPAITAFPFTGSVLSYWDGGPVGFFGTSGQGTGAPPLTSDPPRLADGFGGDPHNYTASDPEGRRQGSDFMDGSIPSLALACGGDPPPCYSNGFPGAP